MEAQSRELYLYVDFSLTQTPAFSQAAWGAAVFSPEGELPLLLLGGPLYALRLDEATLLDALTQARRLYPETQWKVFVADDVTLQQVGEVAGLQLALSYRTDDRQRFAHQTAATYRDLLTMMKMRRKGDTDVVIFRVSPLKAGKPVAVSIFYGVKQTALSFPEQTPDNKLASDLIGRLSRFGLAMTQEQLQAAVRAIRQAMARREKTVTEFQVGVREV